MQLIQLFLIEVVRFALAVWTSFRKLVAFMTFVKFFRSLILFVLFNFLDHVSCFLGQVTVGFFPRGFFVRFLLFCCEGGVLDFPRLEFNFVGALTFSVLFAFRSIWLHHFKLSHFLFAFQTSLLLVIQKFKVVFQCACDLFAHKFVFLNCERHVLLFILRIVKSSWCFDCVTMRYVF